MSRHHSASARSRKREALAQPAEPYRRPARHIGFLTVSRGMLVLGAMAGCGILASVPAFPAEADVYYGPVEEIPAQTFVAPAVAEEPVTRDQFAVTEFTLVQWPVPTTTTMSSGFGYRECAGCSSDHQGIDLNPGNGYPVQAIADGVVIEAVESDAGLGVHVIIQHTIDGQVFDSVYGHMQFGSLQVAVGDTVSRGEQLGVVGSTGQSTGPHLHFEIHSNGVAIDPYPWLLQYANS